MRAIRFTLVALSLTLPGCAGGRQQPPTTAPAPGPGPAYPTELRWVRTSAEYRAIVLETYRTAGERLTSASQGKSSGRWGVILDADETVLDNSEYQRRLGAAHARYSDSSWARWVKEQAAPAVPGAVDYTRQVHALGGRVAIVTNRAEALCGETKANLAAVGVVADIVLCQPPGEGDKNPRFQRIQGGSAVAGVPAIEVLQWIGDNIQDFPMLTQAARNDPARMNEFGRRFFALPNPMYGSWERNPEQ